MTTTGFSVPAISGDKCKQVVKTSYQPLTRLVER